MEQESTWISNKTIAIIGGGPAGCACAKFLQNFGFSEIFIFDTGKILRTILPTGGGKCNLTNAIFDFKELAKNYPRGEKFLYSVFSKFAVPEAIDFFDTIGIKTYTREDNRIFPISNSSNDVRKKIINSLKCQFINEKVEMITPGFSIKTNKSKYAFDIVILAIGGHSGYKLLTNLDIKIKDPTQSLVGLVTEEDLSKLSGISIKNAQINSLKGDLLFTHKGISGPLVYKFSSDNARKEMPYKLCIKLANIENLQNELNNNPHKSIKNLINKYIPNNLAEYILLSCNIPPLKKCTNINGATRDLIINNIENFKVTITSKVPDSEVVTCGGIDLDEINPRTMELKKYKNLYCCGEVMDIDGYCGGFNLQNCWSTAFIAAKSIYDKEYLH